MQFISSYMIVHCSIFMLNFFHCRFWYSSSSRVPPKNPKLVLASPMFTLWLFLVSFAMFVILTGIILALCITEVVLDLKLHYLSLSRDVQPSSARMDHLLQMDPRLKTEGLPIDILWSCPLNLEKSRTGTSFLFPILLGSGIQGRMRLTNTDL